MNAYDQDDQLRNTRIKTHYPDCKDCQYDQQNGKDFYSDPTVNAGDIVSETFRWRSTRPKDGEACFHPGWISAPAFLLSVPSIIKNVCSDISLMSVNVVASAKFVGKMSEPKATSVDSGLEVNSSKSTYNEGEFFSLRISRSQSGFLKLSAPMNCPEFFVWERDADGSTRMDEVDGNFLKYCSKKYFGHEPESWRTGFRMDSGAVSMWGSIGEHELQVFQRVGPFGDPKVHLVASNILHIQIVDPKFIQRKWAKVKGIAADITLDKDTY